MSVNYLNTIVGLSGILYFKHHPFCFYLKVNGELDTL